MSVHSDYPKETVDFAINSIIEKHMESHIKQAVIDYEESLREEISRIVMELHRFYSVKRNETELLITVKIASGVYHDDQSA